MYCYLPKIVSRSRILLFAFTRRSHLPCLLCTFVACTFFYVQELVLGFRTQNSTSPSAKQHQVCAHGMSHPLPRGFSHGATYSITKHQLVDCGAHTKEPSDFHFKECSCCSCLRWLFLEWGLLLLIGCFFFVFCVAQQSHTCPSKTTPVGLPLVSFTSTHGGAHTADEKEFTKKGL